LPYALLRAMGHRARRVEILPSAAFGRRKTPHPDATHARGVYRGMFPCFLLG
jgi:hypothetical protein